MNDDESFSLIEVVGVVLTDTVIPVVILICFVTTLVTLRRATRIRATKGFRYFLYAIGSFVFSLALPFVAFPVRLAFDVSESPAANSVLLAISAAAIVSGTYFLVKGTRQLRAEADAA